MNCMIDVAAVLLGILPEEVKKRLGFERQLIFPDLPAPRCYSTVIVDQLQPLFFEQKKCLVEFQYNPCIYADAEHVFPVYAPEDLQPRFIDIISKFPTGILGGYNTYEVGHAYLVFDKVIKDLSAYKIVSLEDINPIVYYAVALI